MNAWQWQTVSSFCLFVSRCLLWQPQEVAPCRPLTWDLLQIPGHEAASLKATVIAMSCIPFRQLCLPTQRNKPPTQLGLHFRCTAWLSEGEESGGGGLTRSGRHVCCYLQELSGSRFRRGGCCCSCAFFVHWCMKTCFASTNQAKS